MDLIFTFIFGLLIGSFLNVIIYRLPREESIAFPPSHCTECGWKIKPWENIPLISYLFLKGKCSSCKTKISPIYPFVEFLTGVLYVLVYLRYSFTVEGYIGIIFVSLLICIFFIDLKHYIIPDSILLIILFLSIGKILVVKEPTFWNGIITMIITFVIFYLLFILSNEKFGGGDVKLFTVLGLFFGWPQINLLIILASISGLLIGGGLILLRITKREDPIPFGPFIVFSSIITLFYGEEIWRIYEELILVSLL